MKQAKIRLDIMVDIEDEKISPDKKHKTVPVRVHTNFKETLADLLFKAGEVHRDREKFNRLLDQYAYLCILDEVGVSFTPLTTKEALKLKDCEIVEVDV